LQGGDESLANTINIKQGSDIFESLRKGNFYYIDKSLFIKELFDNLGQVNLITRPRRFGKSLNLSMLKSYLEIGADPALFEGLAIEGEKEIYDKHFGKHPVLHLSLAGITGGNFDKCIDDLAERFIKISLKWKETLDSSKLNVDFKNIIEKLIDPPKERYIAFVKASLDKLTSVLYSYYRKEVVILIDEYDSMVTHAIGKGYEKELCEFLSGFFGNVFKSNDQVEFVVLTGCLRIAKESIFTGANNLKVSTVSDLRYSGSFGLIEEEVAKALEDFGFPDSIGAFRDWYDGYLFRDKRIYNTCSVMCYCEDLLEARSNSPQSYWANTSGNEILIDILNKADSYSKLADLERLVFGGTVSFDLQSNINIRRFHDLSAMWSVLVHSGYLTPCGEGSSEYCIPNKEIKNEFVVTVLEWVKERVSADLQNRVVEAIWASDTDGLSATLNDIFMEKMSFHDSQEYAYHMILLGIMVNSEVKSNGESGNGRSDIALVRGGRAAILELKKSHAKLYMLSDALRGIIQIRDRRYGRELEIKGLDVIHYGISFCKKECFSLLETDIDEDLIEKAIGDMEAAAWAINWKIDKNLRAKAAKKKKGPAQPHPAEMSPVSERWFPEREKELEVFKDVLDNERSNFNFALLLETTTKLLRDLNWLLETEKARSNNQALLDLLLN
jgi:hypothetical protein